MTEPRMGRVMDGSGPAIFDALDGDPTFHFERRALRLLEADQARWSYRYLRPVARVGSRVTVALIILAKRLVPLRFSSHDLLDRLGIWFLSHFVSEEGGELLLRHFVIETNVLAFIARNTGLVEPTLRPETLADLGDNGVIVHDLNLYQVLADLGGRPLPRSGRFDYSMLAVGPIAVGGSRRMMRLDLETGMCFMNVAFCLLTTSEEYRRAVHSLQLDESLLSILAELTDDPRFLAWKPAGYNPIVRTNRDVPRDLFAHAVVHEYIHARLLRQAAMTESALVAAAQIN